MKTKAENIIHLYLYQETTQGKLIEINQFGMCKTLKNNETYEHRVSQLKLLLRPLTDIRVNETQELNNIMTSDQYFITSGVENSAVITSYLLARGFDLFGLIESGQAINKLTNL